MSTRCVKTGRWGCKTGIKETPCKRVLVWQNHGTPSEQQLTWPLGSKDGVRRGFLELYSLCQRWQRNTPEFTWSANQQIYAQKMKCRSIQKESWVSPYKWWGGPYPRHRTVNHCIYLCGYWEVKSQGPVLVLHLEEGVISLWTCYQENIQRTDAYQEIQTYSLCKIQKAGTGRGNTSL